jgi:hypothetical protein
MATVDSTTAAAILDEVIAPIEPAFAPDFARMVLSLHLSNVAQDRVRDLLGKNNAGTLNATEKAALDSYLLVGQFLDLLQAKARLSMQNGASSS